MPVNSKNIEIVYLLDKRQLLTKRKKNVELVVYYTVVSHVKVFGNFMMEEHDDIHKRCVSFTTIRELSRQIEIVIQDLINRLVDQTNLTYTFIVKKIEIHGLSREENDILESKIGDASNRQGNIRRKNENGRRDEKSRRLSILIS